MVKKWTEQQTENKSAKQGAAGASNKKRKVIMQAAETDDDLVELEWPAMQGVAAPRYAGTGPRGRVKKTGGGAVDTG